ncbi:hypothetical protein TNCV_3197511 [Trichonephila clavipes]|nr:hypothetical protein TNCV_3197511 [Trichonephila clavipes]
MNALGIRRFPEQLKTFKMFLWWSEQSSNNDGMKTKTTVFLHLPYSPDFTPCDYRIFTDLVRPFQGRRFQSEDEIKSASLA